MASSLEPTAKRSRQRIVVTVHGDSPGFCGARAAPLIKYLDKSHHGVQLSDEDVHRITLWLDCNSEFFGAYENTAAQARGEVVGPSLD